VSDDASPSSLASSWPLLPTMDASNGVKGVFKELGVLFSLFSASRTTVYCVYSPKSELLLRSCLISSSDSVSTSWIFIAANISTYTAFFSTSVLTTIILTTSSAIRPQATHPTLSSFLLISLERTVSREKDEKNRKGQTSKVLMSIYIHIFKPIITTTLIFVVLTVLTTVVFFSRFIRSVPTSLPVRIFFIRIVWLDILFV
jgi:hypothetical protein